MSLSALKSLDTIRSDFLRLGSIVGWDWACRWMWAIARNCRECREAGSLLPADRALGSGPFPVRKGRAEAVIFGEEGMSGIREIWCRDVYFSGGFLQLRPGDVVVDLGANMGNFTVLALAQDPGIRVLAVEMQHCLIEKLRLNVDANGWLERVEICEALVGGVTRVQASLLERDGGEYATPSFTEDELIASYQVSEIGLLKCDIEGSEFELLGPSSALLKRSRQVAVEVHSWAGDTEAFERMLNGEGFSTICTDDSSAPDGRRSRVLLGRR